MSLRKIFTSERLTTKLSQLAQLDEFEGGRLANKKQSDPFDFIIRQELKSWGELQRPPQHSRSRLLLKAAQQSKNPISESSTVLPRMSGSRPASEGKKPEFLANYLALAFQFNQIRLVT